MIGPPSDPDPATATFEAERPRLLGLAYRITGCRTTAEDLVQEAWLRWCSIDPATVRHPAGWLTTTTSRLALDHLKAARHTREAYVGPWLPEVVSFEPDPADQHELAESVTIGFLAVLERLGPTERVVFLLADVFGQPFDEIATIVDRSPAACRQVASRARARVRDDRPRFAATDDDAWSATAAFLTAAQLGDLESLVSLLTDDAVAVSDGGAARRAARRPVTAARIPRFIANLTARVPPDATVAARLCNGQPGVVVEVDGTPDVALVFAVIDGLIDRIWIVRNPDKLVALDAAPMR